MASKVSGIIEKIQTGGSSGTVHAIASTAYGVCDTAANEQYKNIDMTGFKLEEGVTIHVKFTNANSADNPKLKFNNEADTNAKPIVQDGTTAISTTAETNGWQAGAVLTLTYDGTSWVRDQGYNTNTHGAAYGKIKPGAASNSDSAITSNTTQAAAKGENEVLTINPGNKWIQLAGSNSNTAGSDTFTIAHAVSGVTAGTSSPNAAQTPGYGNTFNIPTITVDSAGHVTTMGTVTVQIPASDNTDEKTKQSPITTNAEYNILLKNSTGDSEETASVKFASNTNTQVTINPSTGAITAPGGLIGTASKATADASGNTITTTYAKLASPALTGTPTAPTAANGTNSTQIATTEFVYNTLSVADALVFKGILDSHATATATVLNNVPASGYSTGWTYKVAYAGTYAGQVCEIGDMVIAVTDAAANQSAVNNDHWNVVQTNIDGAVIGPASSTNGHIALFDGTTGKLIKDSGATLADTTVGYADAWTNNRALYVALGTASKTVEINGAAANATAVAVGVDGVLNVANGGTGQNSWTPYGILYASANTTLSQITAGASTNNTQVLISKGAAAPDWYGGLTLAGSAAGTYIATFAGTTDSSATNNGALIVSGGVGIAKKLYVGTGVYTGDISIGGSSTASDAAARTIATSTSDLIFNVPTSKGIIFKQNGTAKINLVSNTFYPETTNQGSIGTSNKYWADVYATNIHGTLDGTATGWTNAQKVKVALGTTYGTGSGQSQTTINGGQTSVQSIGVDGVLGVGHGGTGYSTYTVGQILYCGTVDTLSQLNGNTTTTRKFLRSVAATAGTATAPAWDTLTKADVGLDNVTNDQQLPIAGGTMTGALTVKGLKGTSNIDYGTTLPSSPSAGQIFFQISDPWYEIPSGGTTGQVLTKASSVDRDVEWTTISSAGDLLVPNTTTTYYVCGSSSSTANAGPAIFDTSVYVSGSVLFGAAWNDYAEYRHTINKIEPGRCVVEDGFDSLVLSSERMQAGAEIVSDTFGFAIGQTEKCQTPIAVTGRVLAYPYEDINKYKPGMPVCSGPNGTVSLMTEVEARNYPWLIIGTVSAIPQEKTWGTNNVSTENRVWIRVR